MKTQEVREMKQEVIKTIAALFSRQYGETATPEEVAGKMFYGDEEMQAICTDWLKSKTSFKSAQYISPELFREVQRTASCEFIAAALNGQAREIVALYFPCTIVWCESCKTGITDPYTHDLPEYARIDLMTGAVTWERHADLLTAAQRKKIIISALCIQK